MDKCIKVLIPTGEVRLIRELSGYYPADDKSLSIVSELSTDCSFSCSFAYDGWVNFLCHESKGHLLFPIIAQYGDEFPV